MDNCDPELIDGIPIWCHHHAPKMKLVAIGIHNDMLLIKEGNIAEVLITRQGTGWLVTWKINHGGEDIISGKVHFSDDILERAFNLLDIVPNNALHLIERFGGTTAATGKFIRWKDYLNIPGPGTGCNDDPNVSIKIDDEIRNAVKQLIYYSI